MVAHEMPSYGSLDDQLGDKNAKPDNGGFRYFFGAFQMIVMVLFGLTVEYSQKEYTPGDEQQYIFYLDVTVMMVVGFGFLMTFMKASGLTAVGMTFFITSTCIPWAILTGEFFSMLAKDGDYPDDPSNAGASKWHKIQLDINALLQGNFAAAAVLISFGAVIGKLSLLQTAIMVAVEVPLYSFNKEVVAIGGMGTLDMGGTIFIHLFGAYFGLAVSYMLGPPREKDAPQAESTTVSDLLSLLGTVFLWLYWPSFNGATAPLGENQQLYTTANTVMALCASSAWTFVLSPGLNGGKLNAVDIQNATLAGGVAIGASSNLTLHPMVAMLVGTLAGLLSTYGFNRIQSRLEERGLHDSCGVNNLHGMPALLGSVVVTVACSFESTSVGIHFPKGHHQPAAQLLGALFTLLISLVGGCGCGALLRAVGPSSKPAAFRDDTAWIVASDFPPKDD